MNFQVEQSVPICLALSAAGGAIEVFATAVLAFQDAKRKEGIKWTRKYRIAALFLNLFLQVTSSIVGNLFATWFGPVSLVGPVFLSSQLLTNLILFGSILGLEMFTKDMRIGTYIVVISVILLPVVGPAAQENQNVTALLEAWYSLLWLTVLLAGMMLSFILLVVLNVAALQEWQAISLLLCARATAFSVNLTVSKVFIMDISPMMLGISIFLKMASGGIITYALVVQSTAVAQAKFIPLNASALILVNAMTGMIIWQDYNVVGSWVGYVCVFAQLVLGNYLLLGDVELLSPENTHYGRAKAVADIKQAAERRDLFPIEEMLSQEVELDGPDDNYMSMSSDKTSNTFAETSGEEPTAQEGQRQVWSSIYGIDRNTGPRRRQTIFVMDTDSTGVEGVRRTNWTNSFV